MKRIVICLSIAALLPVAARTQPSSPPTSKAPSEPDARRGNSTARTSDLKAMYEDIEIMRRILERELANQHQHGMWPTSIIGMRSGGLSGGNLGGGGFGGNLGGGNLGGGNLGGGNLGGRLGGGGFGGGFVGSAFGPQPLITGADYEFPYPLGVNLQSRPSVVMAFEGNYLKGHGVAYTVSIPVSETVAIDTPRKSLALLSGCAKCHEYQSIQKLVEPSTEPTPKPPTAWEKIRSEVRGTKDDPKPRPTVKMRPQDICGPGNLTETYLKLLAENGHNFKQLSANEHITIAITISGVKSEASPKPPPTKASTETTFASACRTAEEVLALGDLHAKQNKHTEALKCYLDAAKRLAGEPITVAADVPYDTVRQHTETATRLYRNACTKMAQEYLALGSVIDARTALRQAESTTLKIAQVPASPAASAASPLPAKLIIIVSKTALDDVHTGKIDMDQFKKLADVQTFNFPPIEKKTPVEKKK